METRPLAFEDLHDLAQVEQPAINPDATSAVFVLRTVDRGRDRYQRSLWRVPVSGGEPRRLTRHGNDASPTWSPDGARVAFLRSQDGPAQVWVLAADGGEPEQVTDLPHGVGTPAWSPDGTRLAFTAVVDSTGHHDLAAPVVADDLTYKVDGAGFLGALRRQVHVLELASGEVRQVTRGSWQVGDPSWSPDGHQLAFSAAHELDDNTGFSGPAYVVSSTDPRQKPDQVGPASARLHVVGWTGDGSDLLAVGRNDSDIGHAQLLRISLDDHSIQDLCPDLDRNVMPGGPAYPGALPQVYDDGRAVLFCARDRGRTHLYSVALAGGDARCLVGGDASISGMSLTGGTAVAVVATPTTFGEIVAIDLATADRTALTSYQPAHLGLFAPQERTFAVSDGGEVHGWLVRDPACTGPMPVLLDIHGGPHNAWSGTADPVHLYHQVLAAKGWAVLLLNPRGSDGYGEKFYTAALGDWGRADAADFLEPLDQLVAEGTAHPDRLAVTGYSYGGYMTCHLTAHDDRFAAAVAGGAVADLTSMAGTSDVGPPLARLEFGDSPSPLTRVHDVRTPTLLLHGAADERCPLGQAEQWFTALRDRDVPTRLVAYPGGSHLFILDGPPSHRIDWNRRVAEWVEEYAPEAGQLQRRPIDQQHWQARLTELAVAHGVPGAALGVLRLGEDPVIAHHGVLNTATGVEVTDDSLFQIGSITKVWTATVVLQLVAEGSFDLDTQVIELLPELKLADRDVAEELTVRHLLTHTSGIDGDFFIDTGRGDACLEDYVAALADVELNHPLGATFSYCNSGFVIAGRIIEKVMGQTWDQAMRARLFVPMGLAHTVTLPEEALAFRTAIGHVGKPAVPASVWGLPRALGPAGLINATASDVLTFAALHLREGNAADGREILPVGQVVAMRQRQVDVPAPHPMGDSWGLGWNRSTWDGHEVVGHDGNTIGQSAFLRVLPDQGLAVTLLTNGGNARDLYQDLFTEIFTELANVTLPEPFAPPPEPPRVDTAGYVGVYERAGQRIEVRPGALGLRMITTVTGLLADLMPKTTEEFDLVPVSEGTFAYRADGVESWTSVVFEPLATGATYLHSGGRATPRVS
ncbi:serine hydrolase [Nocardioides panzhihuensis]|uniref:Dipeptidyl aminopeptidase/acylaminoacyl peptidase/CubicO group peptidase (Beta-lactamase class C family) n=1 Tax=Nocardioides panzhihuensis TaxID=860243 RepID=A0A7Z0DLT4_9ACTN|nr:serine hydrolase [Nocardioides panzhihuensis]NYI77664.1 dipeptidyl aminopeptidase/acylaminoacyl peptidase/CubicO group peptidase (beta-lactamase class C family) [Nocardioides panzhihuensis]